MKELKSDYKVEPPAKCDHCGKETYNRCGPVGIIICDDCKEGNKSKSTNELNQYVSLIQSMSLDMICNKLTIETYVSNLKMMATNMEKLLKKEIK